MDPAPWLGVVQGHKAITFGLLKHAPTRRNMCSRRCRRACQSRPGVGWMDAMSLVTGPLARLTEGPHSAPCTHHANHASLSSRRRVSHTDCWHTPNQPFASSLTQFATLILSPPIHIVPCCSRVQIAIPHVCNDRTGQPSKAASSVDHIQSWRGDRVSKARYPFELRWYNCAQRVRRYYNCQAMIHSITIVQSCWIMSHYRRVVYGGAAAYAQVGINVQCSRRDVRIVEKGPHPSLHVTC